MRLLSLFLFLLGAALARPPSAASDASLFDMRGGNRFHSPEEVDIKQQAARLHHPRAHTYYLLQVNDKPQWRRYQTEYGKLTGIFREKPPVGWLNGRRVVRNAWHAARRRGYCATTPGSQWVDASGPHNAIELYDKKGQKLSGNGEGPRYQHDERGNFVYANRERGAA